MKQYLCDANIISELMRRKPNECVRSWSRQIDELSISVITIDEIGYGLHRQNLTDRINWFKCFIADNCTVLPVDNEVALRAGQVRGQFASKGIARSQPDMLIAATAWAHKLTLATRNTKDFEGTDVPLFNPFGE
ncbi:type II toxin-antitoxin system VapC family toxin [Coraliomargarita parva]|uniref:type II toxin-antitoxin system VapC family toxin n=1 Tax=Coraliomargarita parva TaxID=3014050 RepID=UPI0022B2D9F9|nr:type II toxin-antitoxin system VapC family toxin [Coraliomargarita parva]